METFHRKSFGTYPLRAAPPPRPDPTTPKQSIKLGLGRRSTTRRVDANPFPSSTRSYTLHPGPDALRPHSLLTGRPPASTDNLVQPWHGLCWPVTDFQQTRLWCPSHTSSAEPGPPGPAAAGRIGSSAHPSPSCPPPTVADGSSFSRSDAPHAQSGSHSD